MAVVRHVTRSSLALLLAALIVAAAISFNTLYSARGETPGETFHACLFAGSLTQVSTNVAPSCGRGVAIEWNAQGLPGEQGPKGDTGEAGEKGAQGEPGPAGADASNQISGLVGSTGERFSIGGRGFESSRVSTGHYRIAFPAGTWERDWFPAAVVTPFSLNPTMNLTWAVQYFELDPDGSFHFDVVFDGAQGEPIDTHFIFIVTQS